MILSDLVKYSTTQRRVVSLRQLRYLYALLFVYCWPALTVN